MRSRHPLPELSKPVLRQQMRALRRAFVSRLDPDQRRALEAALAAQLAPHLPPGAVIGSYAPVGAEIDPAQAAPAAALPWFADDHAPMVFRMGPVTSPGPFRIPQPDAHAPLAQPTILLVPLLAVTPHGIRLGQGAGHYDRWLARRDDVRAIGCAWDLQIVDALPQEPHDMLLHAIATPTRYLICR